MNPTQYSGETSAERRRYPRIPLTLSIQFMLVNREKLSPAFETVSADLGVEGLAMTCEKKLEAEQKVLLTLLVPENASNKLRQFDDQVCDDKGCIPVAVLSRVAWCQHRNGKKYLVGVQFLEITETGRDILKTFFVDYKLDYSKSSLMK
ncbi:MAG: PilZ domain-containing protein [candidate division FCPU426 bacterium]